VKRLGGILLLALLAASCGAETDYAEIIAKDCDYIPDYTVRPKSSLTPACRAKLLEAIGEKLDAESFKDAPPGLLDRMLESFQALYAYPLAHPPQNTFLGVMPTDEERGISSGAFNLKTLEAFDNYGSTLNRSIFNYVLGSFDHIRYRQQDSDSGHAALAETNLCWSVNPRELRITQNFLSKDDPTIIYYYPFIGAAVLVHEAAHSWPARHHTICTNGRVAATLNCDQGFGGAYGLELAYFQRLLHGSAAAKTAGTWEGFNVVERTMISLDTCSMFQNRVLDKAPDFEAILSLLPNGECLRARASWMEDLEGLKF